MADMELVIKIPDEEYKDIKYFGTIVDESRDYIADCILKGTILPKRHGRLIDADELTKEIKGYISDTSNLHYIDLVEAEAYNSAYDNCLDEIEDADTIIEAEIALDAIKSVVAESEDKNG